MDVKLIFFYFFLFFKMTTIFLPCYIYKKTYHIYNSKVGETSEYEQGAITSLVEMLVENHRFSVSHFIDMYFDFIISEDSIFNIGEEDVRNMTDLQYINHIVENIDGDYSKLIHYCNLLGDSYYKEEWDIKITVFNLYN